MVKSTITKWWIVGAIVMVVGGILAIACSLALVPHIQNATGGFQSTYVPDSYFWMLISFIVLGGIVVIGGIAFQFVAWIGAVFNTNRLVDKTWFNILLWGGIVGIVLGPLGGLGALFWWGLMISYLVGGPDGMAGEFPVPRAMPTAPPQTLRPTG